MLSKVFVLTCLVVCSQGILPSKINKITPSITNSFVNLGKVDISFHIHKNEPAKQVMPYEAFPHSPMRPSEPCPCHSQNMQAGKNLFSFRNPNPTNILKKLFGAFDEPRSAMSCCDSHELIHEDTIIMDFEPIQSRPQYNPVHPMKPNLKSLESLLHSDFLNLKPMPLPKMAPKAKAIEFFFVPPNKSYKDLSELKELPNVERTQPQSQVPIVNLVDKKDYIVAAGDKSKTFQYIPHVNAKSVKKDLHVRDKEETTATFSTNEIPMEITTGTPVANVNTV